MYIRISNEYGAFEIGGGAHPIARLQEIAGIGVPAKEDKTIVFEKQAGQTLTSSRVLSRTITMSFDFYGDEREVQKLYRIIYRPVTLKFFLGENRRQIKARCNVSTEITKIIYHKWQSIVLQFICDDPFFYDFYDTVQAISANIDMLPNSNENGAWYISLPAIATERTNETNLINTGDEIIYPVIKLNNNAQTSILSDECRIILRNNTTGNKLVLNYNILAGDEITIDLPNRKIASSHNGNITNYISDDTVLSDFYLSIGDNQISLEKINISDDIFAVAYFQNKYMSVVI